MFDLSPIKSAINQKLVFGSTVLQPSDLAPNGTGFTLQVPGSLRFDSHNKRVTYVAHGYDRVYATYAQLAECIDQIGRFSWSEHREVTNDDVWKQIYGFVPNFSFKTATVGFNGQLEEGAPRYEDAVPCTKCGMVLPLFAIEVDHRFPQVGDSYMAVIKVFRAIGLTAIGATGRKGLHVQAHTFGHQVPQVTIRPPHSGPPRTDKFDAIGKATPTDLGELLIRTISVLDEACRKKFIKACMNSFVNLQPMCRSCNGGKSNEWAPLFSGY